MNINETVMKDEGSKEGLGRINKLFIASIFQDHICDLSCKNHTNGYPFKKFKPFACCLSAFQEQNEAVSYCYD